MNLIKAIRELFAPKPYDPSAIKVYLCRGTMEQIKTAKPYYVGEIVVCLDEPFLAVGTVDSYDLIAIDPGSPAAAALRTHYSEAEWIAFKTTW